MTVEPIQEKSSSATTPPETLSYSVEDVRPYQKQTAQDYIPTYIELSDEA